MSVRKPDGLDRDATIVAIVRSGVPAVSAIYRFGSSVTEATHADLAPASRTSSTARTLVSTRNGVRFSSASGPKALCMADDVLINKAASIERAGIAVATRTA